MQLSTKDAYGLRRALSMLPVDDVDLSGAARLLLSVSDPATEIGRKRLTDALQAHPDMMRAVLQVDPTAPLQDDRLVINANELHTLVKPEYAMSSYPFYRSGFNALVGASGTGKSFVALDFAGRLAWSLKSGSVLYVAAEGLHGYSSRWEAWKKHTGEDTNRLEFYREPVNMLSESQVDAFIDDVASYSPVMIVLDTVARCMAGGDENSTRDMTQFVDQVERVRRYFDCGILVVHHTGKDGKMRGNTALYAACDSVLFLSRTESRIGLHNSHDKGGKNKYSKEAQSRYLQLRPIEVTVNDMKVQSAALVEAEMMVQSAEDEISSNQRLILEVLDAYGESGTDGQTLVAGVNLAQSTVYYNLRNLQNAGHVRRDGDTFIMTESGKNAL